MISRRRRTNGRRQVCLANKITECDDAVFFQPLIENTFYNQTDMTTFCMFGIGPKYKHIAIHTSPLSSAKGSRCQRRFWALLVIGAAQNNFLKLNSTTRARHGPDTDKVRARGRVRAQFHYTDPTGPARTLSATRTDPTEFRRKKVWVRAGPCRVRVVEFSSYPTTCTDFVRVGSVSVSV